MNLGDTIVAVSSPAGAGERAILRLSGPRAVQIADSVFVPDGPGGPEPLSGTGGSIEAGARRGGLASAPTYTGHMGRLAPPAAGLAVPASVYLMRAPRSYTREDVVEFHVGAWPAAVPVLLAGLIRAGARAAEPGEFTLRALLAGRLDLAQAEAVMAVVTAPSEAGLRAAEDLLGGRLSREISALIDRLREVLALVEADLDFSDQDIEVAPASEIARRVASLRDDLAAMGRRSRSIETFGGEVRLVLAGWPNVGKSSLFNRLLEADRAIVTPVPGTTRDELRAALHVGRMTFALSDVAGLDSARRELGGRHGQGLPARRAPTRGRGSADTEHGRGSGAVGPQPGAGEGDHVAVKARAKALEAIGRADLVILALDSSAPSYDKTEELLALVAAPMVVAATKCDLAPPDRVRAWFSSRGIGAEVVATSAVTGEGIGDLRQALVRCVEGGAVNRQAIGPVVTGRHRAAMERAAVALARAARQARRGRPAGELVALELGEAIDSLADVLGRKADADVLGEIFSRFCIGK
jgi:tRNA modification GTPase